MGGARAMKRCLLIRNMDWKPPWLQDRLQPGDQILSLAMAPFLPLQDFLPNVALPEDFLPYAEIRRIAARASEINQTFAALSCRGAVLYGYDWPKISSPAHDYFFRDVLFAEALAAALRERDLNRIVWVGDGRPEPNFALPTFSVFVHVLKHCLGDRFEVWPPPPPVRQLLASCQRKAHEGIWLLRKRVTRRTPPPECHVAAIFPSTEEWERFSNPLAELHREYEEAFQIWSLGRISARLREWAREGRVRIVWVPYPDRVQPDVTAFFRRHWDHWRMRGSREFAARAGCPVLASDELRFHFAFYFTGIWPRMAEYARVLERYLRAAHPHWLIGSTDPIPPQFFPYHVAAKLGIASVALPHGYVQTGDTWIQSSFLACRNRFERAHFFRSFPGEEKILYCRNAADPLSYAPESAASPPHPDKVVMVLTADPDFPQALMPMANRKALIDAFARLADIPRDLAGLRLRIKSHPRWDLSALFAGLDLKANGVEILNPRSSLPECLSGAWAVVMFNHFGSAVVHAIEAEKPILFLDSAGLFWPHTEWRSFPAGEVAGDLPALWGLLRRLKDSPDFYRELRERCQRFKKEYLQPPAHTLAERIRQMDRQVESPGAIVLNPAPMDLQE